MTASVTAPERDGVAPVKTTAGEEEIVLRRLAQLSVAEEEVRSKEKTQQSRVSQLQQQVDEVRSVMQANISRVMDRGDKLEDLGEKAEYLAVSADKFQKVARPGYIDSNYELSLDADFYVDEEGYFGDMMGDFDDSIYEDADVTTGAGEYVPEITVGFHIIEHHVSYRCVYRQNGQTTAITKGL